MEMDPARDPQEIGAIRRQGQRDPAQALGCVDLTGLKQVRGGFDDLVNVHRLHISAYS